MATRASWRIAPREDAPAELQPLIGEDGFLRLLPHRDDTDGFFAARLVRSRPDPK
jgi:16S rRNA C967 or C1407 C5-methylase (RsmB/RsmF family)